MMVATWAPTPGFDVVAGVPPVVDDANVTTGALLPFIQQPLRPYVHLVAPSFCACHSFMPLHVTIDAHAFITVVALHSSAAQRRFVLGNQNLVAAWAHRKWAQGSYRVKFGEL
jgi:hypothetical protein